MSSSKNSKLQNLSRLGSKQLDLAQREVVAMESVSGAKRHESVTIVRGATALKQFNADLKVLRDWVQGFVDESVPEDVVGYLQDGVVLCNIVKAMGIKVPGRVMRSPLAIIRMNNVAQFITACESRGHEIGFEPADLVSGKNVPLVVRCLLSSPTLQQAVPTSPAPKVQASPAPAVVETPSPLVMRVVQEKPRTPRMATPKKEHSEMKAPISRTPTKASAVHLRVEERAALHRIYEPLQGDELDECLARYLQMLCEENPKIAELLIATPIERVNLAQYKFRGAKMKLAMTSDGAVQVRRGGGFQPLLAYLERRAGIRSKPLATPERESENDVLDSPLSPLMFDYRSFACMSPTTARKSPRDLRF